MSTPADELRAAIKVLRCVHQFPINRPAGSTDKPGVCIHCGVHILDAIDVPGALIEPLAAWLEDAASVRRGLANQALALAVARVINGGES